MYKQYRRYRRILMLADVLCTAVVFAIMIELRPVLPGAAMDPSDTIHSPGLYVGILLLWHALFALTGVYDLSKIPRLSRQISIFTFAFLLAVFMFAYSFALS
jgi:hypothetical protein